jgi:hypothetical protein
VKFLVSTPIWALEMHSMRSRHYDIVRKENNKSAVWLETALDLNTAESRIEELTSFWPGEFQIMDQQNHQIVETIFRPSDRNQNRIGCTKRSLQGLRAGSICANARLSGLYRMLVTARESKQSPGRGRSCCGPHRRAEQMGQLLLTDSQTRVMIYAYAKNHY